MPTRTSVVGRSKTLEAAASEMAKGSLASRPGAGYSYEK
jgi:hypothetical protein